MVHRGHEHSGRMAHLVEELDLPEFDFYAWDARGHGLSPGARGDSPSFATSVRDVQTFIDHLRDVHGVSQAEIVVLAQSVGAVVVATWAHDYAPQVRGLVLASPAFQVKLYVPFARFGLTLLRRLRGNFFVNSYVKARLLTHDPERRASYALDPLITRAISVTSLLGLYQAGERVVADAQAIAVPVQLLVSGADWVVDQKPQRRFFAGLGAQVKELCILQGFFHDTLGERDRYKALEAARRFILERFAEAPQQVNLGNADRGGASYQEARDLAAPLSPLQPKYWYWRLYRAALRLGGRLSDGIRLGHETGFDSGSTLDYVYRNQASGRGWLGRLVDRHYLDAIGWRGIRQRKQHVEELLLVAIARLEREGRPFRLFDIAAGHGRYVLDALRRSGKPAEAVVLRDFSDRNVRDGMALIRERGMDAMIRFEKGDAFDRAQVAAVYPRPTVAIVSGLYELFTANEAVVQSLAGLAEAVEDWGYLIYTNQPWHPQLEVIARSLTSHRGGAAWVMRRRSQAEMDQLVASAGFEKVEQRVDDWGIFTVSLSRRVGQ